jgi:hypothetical protein
MKENGLDGGFFFFEDKKTSDNKNTKIQKEDMTKNKGNPI